MQKNLIVTMIFSVLIAFFAILNAAAIPINLIFTRVDVSAALVILISATIGAIIVYSIDAVSKIKSRKKCKELEKNYEKIARELEKSQEKCSGQSLEIENLKMKIEKLEKGDDKNVI